MDRTKVPSGVVTADRCNCPMGNHIEQKTNFFSVLESVFNQLIHIEKLVEAATITLAYKSMA
jgi:hypothetical protein